MASPNVKAVYANRLNVGQSTHALRRNARVQKLAAHKTIPTKRKGTEIVEKADAEQRQYEQEIGNDDASNAGPADAARAEKGPDAAEGRGPETAGAEAASADAGKDAEPLIDKIKRAVKGKRRG